MVLKRIVLVEDNPADIFLVREALCARGLSFELVCYGDVPEALAGLFDESIAVPDAILLDLNLPRGEGLDILQAVRASARLAHVPVAILTSSQYPRDRERAQSLGINAYIHKASRLEEFLERVGGAVDELLHSESEVPVPPK